MAVIQPKSRASFAEHAAPEAIEAHLKKAKAAAARANREVEWLTELLVARRKQIKSGGWPAIREAIDDEEFAAYNQVLRSAREGK